MLRLVNPEKCCTESSRLLSCAGDTPCPFTAIPETCWLCSLSDLYGAGTAKLLQKRVKPTDYTDRTPGKGKIAFLARERLQCEPSASVAAFTLQSKASEHVGCEACELHPRMGLILGTLLPSESTRHLQQFPSPPPISPLSELLTLKAISQCNSWKVIQSF